MRTSIVAFILFVTVFQLQAQSGTQTDSLKQDQFRGVWVIDLRPTENADPYLKEFVVEPDSTGTFQGLFYGSQIIEGRINTNWDKVYFAFSTKDQNHSYYHSGYVQDNKIYGMSYCPGRAFVAPWTGEKKNK